MLTIVACNRMAGHWTTEGGLISAVEGMAAPRIVWVARGPPAGVTFSRSIPMNRAWSRSPWYCSTSLLITSIRPESPRPCSFRVRPPAYGPSSSSFPPKPR
jgi:hypothetical protein